MIKEKIQSLLSGLLLLALPVGYLFLAYFVLSYSHQSYSLGEFAYLNLFAAVGSAVILLLIITFIRAFGTSEKFLKNLDAILERMTFVFALGVVGMFFSPIFLITENYETLKIIGSLIVWGFYLSLYAIVIGRFIDRMLKHRS